MQWQGTLGSKTAMVYFAVSRKLACKPNLLLLVSVNKDLLEHSHIYSVIHAYGCFPAVSAELSCDRGRMACKTQDVYRVAPDSVLLVSITKIKAHGE